MINCVVCDGWVTRVVYDHTHQWLFGSCVIFSQTAVVVLKSSFRNQETVTEMGRLIFHGFQCEIELDFITVSRLFPSSKCLLHFLLPKGLLKHKELVSVNLSELILTAVFPSAALCLTLLEPQMVRDQKKFGKH